MSTSRRPLVVIDIVGLTPSLLGEHTPNLNRLADDGWWSPLEGVFPALTCPAQASMLTGLLPTEHGIVANGWYFRDLSEIWLWRQSNHLVQGEKVWHAAKRQTEDFTCAKMFWWYNMYAEVEYSVTPRPVYPADGRKIPGIYSNPSDLSRRLETELGPFPLFNFWGPTADIRSSEWIASSARQVFQWHRPALTLVYLPHLDYNLQRLGPEDPAIRADVAAVDRVAGQLIEQVRGDGADVMVVSEYGIEQATGHIHINRVLRQQGYLAVQETLGWELLDAGASRAFSLSDHQVAHIYIRDHRDIPRIRQLLATTEGIDQVLDEDGKKEWGIDHPRAGELVAVAAPGCWFTYYYWLDDSKRPDFANSVDIHRKPGYDPVELFIDPGLRFPKLKIGWRLLQKQLGIRMLMDVIPLDATLVKGTHGRLADTPDLGPLVISSRTDLRREKCSMPGIKQLILDHFR